MYKPFSDPKNIQKMLRKIVVFDREQELANSIVLKDNPFFKLGEPYIRWGKCVSNIASKNRDPLEAYIYWDGKIESEFVEILAQKILKDKNYLRRLEKYFFRTHKNFKKMADLIFKRGKDFFRKWSNEQLASLFKKFNLESGKAIAGSYIPYYSVVALERILENEIKKLPSQGGVSRQEIFEILVAMAGETFIQSERREFLKTLIIIRKIYSKTKNWNDKRIQVLVFKQWYSFGELIFNDEAGRQYTLSDYKDKFFRNLKSHAPVSELRNIEKEGKGRERKASKALNKFKKYPKILRLTGWFGKMITYRNRDAEHYFTYFCHCQSLFDEIAGRLRISSDDFLLLGKNEIIGGLKGGINVINIVEERKKRGFTIKGVGSLVRVITGVKKEDWYENRREETRDLLKGSVASGGRAVARVKVILDARREGDKLKKGEILVTAMTKSEFIPLMERASAIITDEGGIICHAAILARELKKPCIIGARVATRILKDGDLVEVDADKGVVKIIKRNK